MADIIDEAYDIEQLHLNAALTNRQSYNPQPFIGKCYYCGNKLTTGIFCDTDCRDDFQLEYKQKMQRRG